MSRIHVIQKLNNAVRAALPGKHPFNVLYMQRILTRANPSGNPDPTPVFLRGTMDLVAHKPCETVMLTDENDTPAAYEIDYATNVTTPANLLDNLEPINCMMLLNPVSPRAKYELGLIARLGHEVQGIQSAQEALMHDKTKAATTDPLEALDAEENRLLKMLTVLDDADAALFPKES